MCSIGEDDFGDEGAKHAMIPESTATGTAVISGSCNKCGLTSDTVYKLNFRAAECRECFLNYARHKFRAALGASKVLPRNASVLLIVDGSAESLVLLDMLHYAQTQNTFKRLHCDARVLHIDERQLLTEPLEWNAAPLQELQARYAPFEFHVIQLGAKPSSLQKLKDYAPETQQLCGQLEQLRSLTARQDYLQQQRKRLIAGVAKQLDCDHVFEPSFSLGLATQLLTAIALGRGGSAALDVSLLDDRLPHGVRLLRPLKDLSEQELQLYVRAQQLCPWRPTGGQYGDERGPAASLQNLTSAFVANLQQNYASTVSTVFRTGDKIATNRQLTLAEETSVCSHCQSPLDAALSDTLLAIEYSRAISEAGATLDQAELLARRRLAAESALCHACRNIQAELSSGVLL